MTTVTKNFVTQRITRGGGLDVSGLTGKQALEAREIANKILGGIDYTVIRHMGRGGKIDVSGMNSTEAVFVLKEANRILERNAVNSSILYDRAKLTQLVKNLSGLVKDGKINQKLVLGVTDAISNLRQKNAKVTEKDIEALYETVFMIDNAFETRGYEASKYKNEARQILNGIYSIQDKIERFVNDKLESNGKYPNASEPHRAQEDVDSLHRTKKISDKDYGTINTAVLMLIALDDCRNNRSFE